MGRSETSLRGFQDVSFNLPSDIFHTLWPLHTGSLPQQLSLLSSLLEWKRVTADPECIASQLAKRITPHADPSLEAWQSPLLLCPSREC